MIIGAVAGAGLGLLNPDASAVGFAGIGIAVGLVLGLFLRVVLAVADPETLPRPAHAVPPRRPDVLRGNVDAMAAHARDLGLALRPHAKTHKCAADRPAASSRGCGRADRGHGRARPRCSPAPAVATCSSPTRSGSTPPRARRLRALPSTATLTRRGRLRRGRAGPRRPACPGVAVLVEVDSGHHRTGVLPEAAGAVAARPPAPAWTSAASSPSPATATPPAAGPTAAAQEAPPSLRRRPVARRARDRARAWSAAGRRRARGRRRRRCSTELRPGVYVFGDAQQWELGARARPTGSPSPAWPPWSATPAAGSCWTPAARRSAPTGRRGPPATGGCSTTPTPGSRSSRSTTPSSTGPAPAARRSAAGCASCPTTSAPRSTWPTSWCSPTGTVWPVAARGANT